MKRGIHQGCPISALIFILAVEILAIKIRNSPDIKGIQIRDHIQKILQYADDSTLTLADLDSIIHSVRIINEFSKLAGTKLNINKSEGIWLGPLKQNGPKCFCEINCHTIGILNKNIFYICVEESPKIRTFLTQKPLSPEGARTFLCKESTDLRTFFNLKSS